MAYGDYYDPSNKTVNPGDVVLASDINSINSAIDTGFELVAADLDTLAASDNYVHSKAWATNAQGVRPDILINDYSSKANATESKEWASNPRGSAIHKADGTTVVTRSAYGHSLDAGDSAASAQSSYLLASAAKFAAQDAQAASEAAYFSADAARVAAELAETHAETAETNAEAAAVAADASADAAAASEANTAAMLSTKANIASPTFTGTITSPLAALGNVTIAHSTSTGLKITNTGTGSGLVVEDTTSDTSAFSIDGEGRMTLGWSGASTGVNFLNRKDITGATTSVSDLINGTIKSDVTGSAYSIRSSPYVEDATFTLGVLSHFACVPNVYPVAATVSNQYGFYCSSSLTGATNNYGFSSQIALGTGRWNFHAAGTADNYFAGRVGIGNVTIQAALDIRKTLTTYDGSGANDATGVYISSAATDPTLTRVNGFITYMNPGAGTNLSSMYHFGAGQRALVGTIGSQYGFSVGSSLVGATNNYGFHGMIPSGTGRWNIYMEGTADNYLAGTLGIGVFQGAADTLHVGRNMTGATSARSIRTNAAAQSDVTLEAIGVAASVGTAAASFTLANLYQHYAGQGTIGAGSTITTQTGFYVDANMVGATNNRAFYGGLPSGTNRFNLYMGGTADNYMAGRLGIGTAVAGSNHSLRVNKSITGSAFSSGIVSDGQVQSDVSTRAEYFISAHAVAAGTYPLVVGYQAQQGTFTGTVTNQHGFTADASLVGAANNYGFVGRIPAGAGRWNFYASGTADNYFEGKVGFGSGPDTFTKVKIGGTLPSGSGFSSGFDVLCFTPAASTVQATGFRTALYTEAASYNLLHLSHYMATQGVIGAGSTVTTQSGFSVDASLIGATNNYGFFSSIPSGTGRWNVYAAGSAANYFAGAATFATSIGYGGTAGVGGTHTQLISRSTTMTVHKICGSLTLFSAAGSATWVTFTVLNDTVAATDVVIINQKSGTNKYIPHITRVAAGLFDVTFQSASGTATDAPVFNFAVIKAVDA